MENVPKQSVRLQKFMADCGVASRRKAEEIIKAGRVLVNGQKITEMGRQIDPDKDQVTVDGVPLKRPGGKKVYIAFNKPQGVLCTASDERGRPTVLDYVDVPERIYPVGRLDLDTEGLILLTNDGELAHDLMHPSVGIEKEYEALVGGVLTRAQAGALQRGIMLDGTKTAPAKVEIIEIREEKTHVRLVIHEGRNRQIRRMMDAVGHRVLFLRRLRVGGIHVGHLHVGAWRHLTQAEVAQLKKMVDKH